MSTELTNNQALELLPLYVLGILEPEEMLAMDAYLSDHQELLPQLHATEAVVAHMAHTAPHAPLPGDAKQRLLAHVRADLELAPPEEHASTAISSQQQPAPTAVKASRRFVLFPDWRLFWGRLGSAFAGALVALLLASVYISQIQTVLTETTLQLNSMRAEVEQLQEALRADQQRLALLANAERAVVLDGTSDSPGSRGTFYLSGNQGVFVLGGLQPLATGQTYQLWLVPPGGTAKDAISVGLLETPADAPIIVIVQVPADLRDFAIVDVSIEPAGGSTHLSGPVVLRGRTPPAISS